MIIMYRTAARLLQASRRSTENVMNHNDLSESTPLSQPLVDLWALPVGQSDRLYEVPLTSFALTEAEADKVQGIAAKDGFHGFRRVPFTNELPNFTLDVR